MRIVKITLPKQRLEQYLKLPPDYHLVNAFVDSLGNFIFWVHNENLPQVSPPDVPEFNPVSVETIPKILEEISHDTLPES